MKRVETAHVVYDSGKSDVMHGLRGAPGLDRSLIFVATSISLDLMVQTRFGEEKCFLCGPVLDPRQEESLPGVEVRIGEERTFTDAFGQFAIGGRWPPADRVITVVTEEADVYCPVPDLG